MLFIFYQMHPVFSSLSSMIVLPTICFIDYDDGEKICNLNLHPTTFRIVCLGLSVDYRRECVFLSYGPHQIGIQILHNSNEFNEIQGSKLIFRNSEKL